MREITGKRLDLIRAAKDAGHKPFSREWMDFISRAVIDEALDAILPEIIAEIKAGPVKGFVSMMKDHPKSYRRTR